MTVNRKHSANELTYVNFSSKWVWRDNKKKVEEKKRIKQLEDYTLHIHQVENDIIWDYYLTLWNDVNLFKIRVDGYLHKTYKEVCHTRGLLGDSKEIFW